MTPFKPQHQVRPVEVVQLTGVAMIIAFAYRHFGPQSTTPVTFGAVATFVGAVLALGVITLKLKD